MARFEIGKGKKKTYWDIEQLGRVVRTQEIEPVAARLSGYRTFRDEKSAQREIEKLISERLAKAFAPADDAARLLAGTVALPAPEKKTAPTLPVRRDLDIYNEANGFMVTSMKLAGVALAEGSAKWNKAVADAKMIPMMLFQDDPFVVRVVAGDQLTAPESEEWVARLDWWLTIPDGKLAITGGAVLTNDEYDGDDPYFESYLGVVELPPGFYRATIYSYVPGINGNAVLDHLAGGDGKAEPYGKWFRRTRPGAPFPAWLRDWCAGDDSTDPGHVDEWKNARLLPESEKPDYVHFLVHLDPAKKEDLTGKPELADGWFGEAHQARKPERCPLGLEGREVIRSKRAAETGDWIYVHEVYEKLSPLACAPLAGGPVELDLSALPDLYRLAWFSHLHSVPEMRFTLPATSAFNIPENWPVEAVARAQDGVWRVSFSNSLRPVQIIPLMARLAEHLVSLPEGTELELVSSQLDTAALQANVPVGLHRYRGPIVGGQWRIKESFPSLDAESLRAALALSAEVAAGEAITIMAGEADAVMKWAKGHHRIWIEDNPGKIQNGRLTLGKHEPPVLALYGASVFSVRFGKTWPVVDHSADEDDKDVAPVKTSDPVKGVRILETPGGRMYFATDALAVSEKLSGAIRDEEGALRALGFEHAGDLLCNLFARIAVRGYATKGGDTWASYLVAAPDTLVLELSTRFEKDSASLLTTRRPNTADDVHRHTYRQSVTAGDVAGMLERHNARVTELSARFGPPVRVEPAVALLAEAVEAALKKQLGG